MKRILVALFIIGCLLLGPGNLLKRAVTPEKSSKAQAAKLLRDRKLRTRKKQPVEDPEYQRLLKRARRWGKQRQQRLKPQLRSLNRASSDLLVA
ncbi:MAG TPA: hypothetical protein VMX16_06120 [Terriglobia bacterium]|nr:hypothetical protein [Terriglobia bacterium]